jgi:hypothetical protein
MEFLAWRADWLDNSESFTLNQSRWQLLAIPQTARECIEWLLRGLDAMMRC